MSLSRSALIAALGETVLDDTQKGIPLGAHTTLARIGDQGWNVARGDLALPVTTLSETALSNNLTTMADYCARNGVFLAPHGKTTMAPQLFNRQMAAGAWGMTAANPTQAALMRRYAIDRIIIANELVEPAAVRWVASEQDNHPEVEIFSLVDSTDAVRMLERVLIDDGAFRVLPVLLEIGVDGGRAGVRNHQQAISVAQAVASSPHLSLAGVEIYEGLITNGTDPQALAKVDENLTDVRDLVEKITRECGFGEQSVLVTAGGSAYFDRVVAVLGDWSNSAVPAQLVLRSGCYLTHDLGKYHRVSPLDGRQDRAEPRALVNALHGWARVLSTPEPGLTILATGKRDLPYDIDLPIPLTLYRMADGSTSDLSSSGKIVKMMDQHAFMRTTGNSSIAPGDILQLGVSHPCTAFDKARLVPIVDDTFTVVDAVLTFF